MSGFIGLANPGAEVAGGVIASLTRALAFRGPDAHGWKTPRGAALGHALLRTGRNCDAQPLSLDGNTWIVADARIDAQRQLRDALEHAGQRVEAHASDAALILAAFAVWGDDCVEHLLGDFAFAIWDERRQRLFCARDHFGVKPFFHARVGREFLFGNTLSCLRRHPGVGGDLDDLAIADFLLFESYQNPDATAFAQIRRLPAGHVLICDARGLHLRQYWSLRTNASRSTGSRRSNTKRGPSRCTIRCTTFDRS
jgi:asparagine synthase (glutamine-hydrolysing)